MHFKPNLKTAPIHFGGHNLFVKEWSMKTHRERWQLLQDESKKEQPDYTHLDYLWLHDALVDDQGGPVVIQKEEFDEMSKSQLAELRDALNKLNGLTSEDDAKKN